MNGIAGLAAGVGSAVAAGAAVVAQQHAAHALGGADHRLLTRPWWLAGTAVSVLAVGLQALALTGLPLVAVQALLASGVAWAALGQACLARRVPAPRTGLGVALAVGGPALVVTQLPVPHQGARAPELGDPIIATPLLGVAMIAGLGLVLARRRPGPAGAPGLALACGVGYGLSAALLAVLARAVTADRASVADPGVVAAAALLAVVGPAAFGLSQRALARAGEAGGVMTIILLADPVVAAATGALWFGERPSPTPAGLAGVLVGLGVAVAGIRLLTAAPARSQRPSTRRAPS